MVNSYEVQLLRAHRANDQDTCLRLFGQLTNIKKIEQKWLGLYMIGKPRMFVNDGRVTRALKFVDACFERNVYDMFDAVCSCVKKHWQIKITDGVEGEDEWALMCALSLKYWLGSVHVSDLSTLFGKVNMRDRKSVV